MTKTVVTSYDQVQEWSIVSDAVRHENFRMKFSLFNLEGTREWTGDGGLAQLGERLPCKQEVSGSIPLISTNSKELTEALRNKYFIEFLWRLGCTLKTEHCEIMMQFMRRQQ